jgi:hemerythrin-like domain-containing protein
MSDTTRCTLPGLHSPAAGFDAPFEVLAGCHERVRRSLALLERLLAHLAQQGVDAAARSAAQDVWRYFDIAAPQHHQDEERHVIPLLLASGDGELMAAARQMRGDHERMNTVWSTLGPALQGLAQAMDGALPAPQWQALAQDAQRFLALHATHVPLEDALAFPAARDRTDSRARAAMGQEMARRRGVAPPPATAG